jgi:hypothetical protein
LAIACSHGSAGATSARLEVADPLREPLQYKLRRLRYDSRLPVDAECPVRASATIAGKVGPPHSGMPLPLAGKIG